MRVGVCWFDYGWCVMTKYELNKRLAELLGFKIAGLNDAPFNYYQEQKSPQDRFNEYRERYPDSVWCLKDGEPWEQYVFTSDWSQIMPIAEELKINLSVNVKVPDVGWVASVSDFKHYHYEHDEDAKVALVKCCIFALESKDSK